MYNFSDLQYLGILQANKNIPDSWQLYPRLRDIYNERLRLI